MPYQSFTDVLQETKEHYIELAESKEEGKRLSGQAGLELIQEIEKQLLGHHIVPTAIYRAVALAQLKVPADRRAAGNAYSLEARYRIGEKLIRKADAMARHATTPDH